MSKKQIDKKTMREIRDAWFNLDVPNSAIINPFEILRTDEPDDFHKRLTYLLMEPDFFHFICKHILNIELLPFQALILKEMWQRKFPMLIASRGAGKTFMLSLYALLRALLLPGRKIVIAGAAFRQSKFLHEYMEGIWRNAPILRDICDSNSGPSRDVDMCRMRINGSIINSIPIGDGCCTGDTLITGQNGFLRLDSPSNLVYGNGKFREIDYPIDNGVKPTKIITTKKGYSYEGTHNHAMKVCRDGSIQWVRTDDMQIGDRILIDRSERWHNSDVTLTKDEAYMLGAMIGDGNWTSKYKLGFATKDDYIINRINSCLPKKFVRASDGVHWHLNSKEAVEQFLGMWGLDKCYTIDKVLPSTILSAGKDKMTECLRGLFDTDGHVFSSTAKGGLSLSVNLTNTSETLMKQVQYILLHYGIISTLTHRDRDEKWNRIYELGIYGIDAKKFYESIGFGLPRKQDKLKEAVLSKKRWMSNNDTIPAPPIDGRKFLQMSYAIKHKDKLSHISELINPDIFYDTVATIEDSECHTYDIHVPEGNEYCANGFFSHNSKIRGLRANDIIADEFASMSRDIFENVIAGFAAVSASPAENHRLVAAKAKAKSLGYDPELLEKTGDLIDTKSNQIILSGTAYYDFNHFAEYWRKWKGIIETRGDTHKIKNNVFNGEEPPEDFRWDDYSIIRIPFELIPKGFMDEGQVARSRATIHNGIYLMEFGAVFAKDSQGFFKRSLIESCTGTKTSPIKLPSENVFFDPLLIGNPNLRYVMGVDPASEVDNFSIVILELHSDHRRVVHCWTTTRKEHVEMVKKGLTTEHNFYSYCARKIRNLMKRFNILHIAMDAQGGGISISEALHDPVQLEPGELRIWPIIEEDKEKPTDGESGLHILELCQFAKYDWYSEANHGLRKDFEDKITLFPRFDPVTIGLSIEEDKFNNRLYDTLEDCVMDIEELKNELCLIEITQTANGRDRWDTPEVKIGVGKKQRMRKDRYSALLMANMAARIIAHTPPPVDYITYGGFAEVSNKKEKDRPGFSGPAWFTEGMTNVY